MGRGRGRPRTVPELSAIHADMSANMQIADVVPTLHRLTPTATRGGMYRREDAEIISDNPDRMQTALRIVERIKLHGGSVQAHHNCVTVSLGRYSECANISSPDVELEKLVNRVINAGGQ